MTQRLIPLLPKEAKILFDLEKQCTDQPEFCIQPEFIPTGVSTPICGGPNEFFPQWYAARNAMIDLREIEFNPEVLNLLDDVRAARSERIEAIFRNICIEAGVKPHIPDGRPAMWGTPVNRVIAHAFDAEQLLSSMHRKAIGMTEGKQPHAEGFRTKIEIFTRQRDGSKCLFPCVEGSLVWWVPYQRQEQA